MNPISLHVVLVRPKFAVNVGYTSRAMANMGVSRLILIDPRCKLDQRAHEGAAGGFGPLSKAVIYGSWAEFLEQEGAGVRIGLTRRDGSLRVVEPLETVFKTIKEPGYFEERAPHVYFVFGPEDHGLDAQDLAHTNWSCSLPSFGEFQSMNLAHAALLTLFLARSILAPLGIATESSVKAAPAYDFPETLIQRWLSKLGFDLGLSSKKNAALRISQMLSRSSPTLEENKLLQDILHQNIRKLELAGDNLPPKKIE